jgi:mechanosensitive ion channel protein 1/2/3
LHAEKMLQTNSFLLARRAVPGSQLFWTLENRSDAFFKPLNAIARSTLRRRRFLRSNVIPRSSTGGAGMPADPSPFHSQPDHPPEEPHTSTVPEPQLTTYHYLTFFVLTSGGLLFVAALIYFTSDVAFQIAISKAFKRLMKTVALGQLSTILSAMAFVKYGLEPVIKAVRTATKAQGPWEKSSEYYILREVYKPLEFLFLVAAFTTLAENFVPQLINLPKGVMQIMVRQCLSLTFVFAATRVVFNIKSRIVRESSWQLELKGDVTRQRRLEAIDKLMSLVIIVLASVFAIRAFGTNLKSVLAIGGVGGVAVGLAGREILENVFTGLIILSSNPFEVGEEVMFRPSSGQVVEGIVVDVGWYRTTIRSFEREIYVIPNSVFSRNVVLNITRKNKEWRFFEFISLRLDDLPRVSAVVADIRKILRQDSRIIQKLHRRVFLDKVTREDISVYISFYVEAANRDAFMAVKQDLLLAFIDCVERNGARLARNRLQLEMLPSLAMASEGPVVDVAALPQPMDVPPTNPSSGGNGNNGGSGSSPSTAGGNAGPDGSSKGASGKDSAAPAPASNIVASATSTSSGSGASQPSSGSSTSSSDGKPASKAARSSTPEQPTSSPTVANSQARTQAHAIVSAMANSPAAAAKIASVVAPDAIMRGSQDGSSVLASFDDNACS